jgi:hypothetical protein
VPTNNHLGLAQDYAARPNDWPFAQGAGRGFARGHIHHVSNEGERPAVSVHVYGPALTAMTRYRLIDGRLAVVAVDRAGAQW